MVRPTVCGVGSVFSMVRPTGLGGVSDFFFEWSAQRAREGFRNFFNGPPNGFGRGFGFFSTVRQTGLGGVSDFFFKCSPNGLRGRGRFFQWSAQRAREGFRFSMVRPTGPGGVSFFNGSPNGSGGVSFFQWFDGSGGVSFFNGLPNGSGGGFVFQWSAQRVWGEGGPVSFGVWWWCRRFFCFGGTGASRMEASQLWSCVLRGMEASQLPGL